MGVWIEIQIEDNTMKIRKSHTLYGCVDWNCMISQRENTRTCHTLYGCVDWNPRREAQREEPLTSHPLWVCGLKLYCNYERMNPEESHPLWVCGLKYCLVRHGLLRHLSHTLYGCVDWNLSDTPKDIICLVTPFMGVWIEISRKRIWCCLE